MYLWGCRVEGCRELGDEIVLAYRADVVVVNVLFTKCFFFHFDHCE